MWIFLPIILGIRDLSGTSFHKVPWCLKYPTKGETLPSNRFYIWIRLQLMWNVEFNTFDEFLWFGIFGPNFPHLLQFPKYTKTGINKPSDGFYIWERFHLMWNVEFNFLVDFLCIGVHNLGYLDPICPTCPNSPNILKKTLKLPLPWSKASFDA